MDGAAGVLVGSREFGEKWGLTPRARIRQTTKIGTDPTIMLTGPVPATEKALRDSGMAIGGYRPFRGERGVFLGGAALHAGLRRRSFPRQRQRWRHRHGPPAGATGAIIIGTLLDELERTGKGTGLATLCVASGMGAATIIERV